MRWERPRAAAQDHPDAGTFSERRGCHEIDLVGLAEYHRDMGAPGAVVTRGDESIRDSLWRSFCAAHDVKCRHAWTLRTVLKGTKTKGKPSVDSVTP
jgi:hypothetical protein